MDVYEEKLHLMPIEVVQTIVNIAKILKQEVELADDLAALQGSMHLLLSGSSIDDQAIENPHNLLPSEGAKKNLVVNLT